jgi:hypothetical protein
VLARVNAATILAWPLSHIVDEFVPETLKQSGTLRVQIGGRRSTRGNKTGFRMHSAASSTVRNIRVPWRN